MLQTLSHVKLSSKTTLRIQETEAIVANISVKFNETLLEVPILNVYEGRTTKTGKSFLFRKQKVVCLRDRLFSLSFVDQLKGGGPVLRTDCGEI